MGVNDNVGSDAMNIVVVDKHEQFTQVTDLNNGYVIASRKGRFGLLSNDGVNIIPRIYEKLVYDKFNDVYLAAGPEEWEPISIP